MPSIFTITTASETVPAAGGRAEISFDVSNTSGRPVRGLAKVVALGATEQQWLRLGGEIERDFPSEGMAQQFTVYFAAPAGTATGKYPLRLDVISVTNPQEDYSNGPTVTVRLQETTPPPFKWWIVLAVAGLLLVGALVAWLARGGRDTPNDNNSPTVTSTPTETPAVTPTITPTVTPTPPRIKNFAGTWNNTSPGARSITRLNVTQEGDLVSARATAKCPPSPECDLGVQKARVEDDKVKLTWSTEQSHFAVELSFQENGNLLVVTDAAYLKDEAGAVLSPPLRSRTVESFRRQLVTGPLGDRPIGPIRNLNLVLPKPSGAPVVRDHRRTGPREVRATPPSNRAVVRDNVRP